MNTKKNAIVTGGTKNQFPAMAVLALNIADKCPNIADELVIFHDGISEEEKNKVNKIFPTRFIEYINPFMNNNFSSTVTNYFSVMVFCKYECFKLLDEYKTVIWTDYDILIKKDISYIKNFKFGDCKFIKESFLQTKFKQNLYYNKELQPFVEEIDFNKKAISTPIFVLYDSFPQYLNFYNDCIKYTSILASSLELPEEGIISICLNKYNIKIDSLNAQEFVTPPEDFEKCSESANILHAVGQPKFWNGLYNKEWQSYYNEWIKKYNGNIIINHNFSKKIKKIIKFIIPYGLIVHHKK